MQRGRKPLKRLLGDRISSWLLISGCSVTNPVFPRFLTQPITHQLRLTKHHHLLVFPWQRLSALHQFHRASKFSSLALESMNKAIIPQNPLQQCLLLPCPLCKRGSANNAQVLDEKYQCCLTSWWIRISWISCTFPGAYSGTAFQLWHWLCQQPAMGSLHWHPSWRKKGHGHRSGQV